MELTLNREPSGGHATLGKLWCHEGAQSWRQGDLLCDTLEDRVRQPKDWGPLDPVAPWKVPGETAIPTGRYQIVLTHSERFNRALPLLLAVPGFAGIRIHAGNTSEDTEGCILTGQRLAPATIIESRAAFARVYERIKQALAGGEQVWITLNNGEINGAEAVW